LSYFSFQGTISEANELDFSAQTPSITVEFIMSRITNIVEQALNEGYLTPAMEAEVGRLCDSSSELEPDEYIALDKLMSALLKGDVVAVPRKQFINVMEELALTEAINQITKLDSASGRELDLSDIAAYALNRLPPLYATTEEGATYQRHRALAELHPLIGQQVQEGIARYLDRPDYYPERQAIKGEQDVLGQVSSLLQDYASKFEQ
jgi:hypothetical protein